MPGLSQKKTRLLWTLAILLVALLLVARYLETTEQDRGPVLSSLSHEQVNRIVLETPGQDTLGFEKNDNGWYLVEPLHRKADTSRIQVLLATLSLPKGTIYTEGEIDPAEAGLQPPRAVLTLNDKRFGFGDPDSNGDRRYLQHDEKITLATDIIYPLFEQGLNGFVDKRLIPPGITRLQTDDYTINKQSGKWQSADMPVAEAETTIATWLEQSAVDILPWPLTNDTALEQADVQNVSLSLAENNTLQLKIFGLPELAVVHPETSDYAMIITTEQYRSLGFGND